MIHTCALYRASYNGYYSIHAVYILILHNDSQNNQCTYSVYIIIRVVYSTLLYALWRNDRWDFVDTHNV